MRQVQAIFACFVVTAVAGAASAGAWIGQDEPPTPTPTPTSSPTSSPTPAASPQAVPESPAGVRREAVDPVYPTTGKAPTPATKPPAAPVVSNNGSPAATIPGLSPETFNVPPGRYFPEGTFLVRRTGTVRALKTGELAFIPDVPSKRDVRRRGERPMILLPSQTLSAMQSAINTSPDGEKTRVEVSGQLFVYRDRQQLLPTIFAVIRPTPETEATSYIVAPEDVAKSPETETTVRAGDDPEIAAMISELEQQRSEVHPATAPVVPEMAAPNMAAGEQVGGPRPLVPEGTLLTDRRGRLVRIGNQLAIAFDCDAENSAEPAMLILRTRALERLEAAIASRSDTIELVLSGRVYAYKNQNYVLPVLAQIESRGQLKPLQ